MSREQELRSAIAKIESEMDVLRARIAPLSKMIGEKNEKQDALKTELWNLLNDDLPTLLKERGAWSQLRDHVARRFGVSHGYNAPVAPDGYFRETGEQAFRIMVYDASDLAATGTFIREILDLASPVTPDGRNPCWQFQVYTPDNNANGIIKLVTFDRQTFQLTRLRYGREETISEPMSLEDSLARIKNDYSMDGPMPEDASEEEPYAERRY